MPHGKEEEEGEESSAITCGGGGPLALVGAASQRWSPVYYNV